jgi:hypothetical protein
MKTRILSLVFALFALFAFSNVYAQKPHINPQDKGNVVISDTDLPAASYSVCLDFARITGLGNATSVTAQLVAEGTLTAACYNKGNPTHPIPGQSFSSRSAKVTFTPDSNGNITLTGICTVPVGGCKSKGGKDWTSLVTEANVTNLYLIINNKQVSLNEFLPQLKEND